MNINTELEKLISLRDRGDLSQAEFEKAKQILLSDDNSKTTSPQETTRVVSNPATGIPGLWLAIGVFVGNFLFITIKSGDLTRGFVVGTIAAVLVVAFSFIARAFKPQ